MSKKDKNLQKVLRVVDEATLDAEVFLFGSQARGDAQKTSDWDLLILLNAQNISFETENKIINALYEVEVDTGEIFSPLIYSLADWKEKYAITPLFERIQKEGIRIR